MNRLIPFLLLVVWIVGAVTAGLTIRAPAPETSGEADPPVQTERMRLTLQEEQVILTVNMSGHDRRRLAVRVPLVLSAWFREDPETRSRRNSTPTQDGVHTAPFHLFSIPTLP